MLGPKRARAARQRWRAAYHASSPDSRASARARRTRRLRVGVGERRRAASRRPARTIRCRRSSSRRRDDRVAPALLRRPPGTSRPVAHEPAAVERARCSSHARPPASGLELGRQAVVAERGEQHEEPRRRVGGAVVANAPSRTASRASCPAGACAVLVADLARLLLASGSRARPARGERAQRRARDVGPRGQHLQRGDQRVAAEQRVVAPGVAGLRPAVSRRRASPRRRAAGRAAAHRQRDHAPCHGPERERPATLSPSRARSVRDRDAPSRPSTATSRRRRLSPGVPLAAPPRPRALGAGSVA